MLAAIIQRLRDRTTRTIVACAAVLVGIAAARVIAGGWDSPSPDHARYLYSGLTLLDGRGYVNEAGDPFLIRSPAYPVILAVPWRFAGLIGSHLAAWGLGLAGLAIAVGLAGRLGGAVAAVGTTAAIVAVPGLWQQIVGLGIDLPQTALFLGAIVLLTEPGTRRWLVAGGVAALAVLVKETVAPAVAVLPLAWLPVWAPLSWSRWLRLTAVFVATVTLLAGWWWLVVWRETGQIFPLNSLAAIAPTEQPVGIELTPTALVVAAIGGSSWAITVAARFRDAGGRLLVLGGVAALPTAVAVILLAQPTRDLTPLVILTCIAVGVAAGEVWASVTRRTSTASATPVRRRATSVRSVAISLSASLLIAVPAAGQLAVNPPVDDRLPADTAAVLRPLLEPGDQIVSTFRDRSALALELFDLQPRFRLLPAEAVPDEADLAAYVWLGVRKGTLFGTRRDQWAQALGAPGAAFLVIVEPHELSPVELLPALRGTPGRRAGVTPVEAIDEGGASATVFVNQPDAAWRISDVALHAAPDALLQWLDRERDRTGVDPLATPLATGPVIPARAADSRQLAERLGGGACFEMRREGGADMIAIATKTTGQDCLDPGQLR